MAKQEPATPKDYSPFTPGIPVPPDFFVGREPEVRRLVEKARAATAGRLERAFVLGDRGIGKSSLCHYAAVAAEREFQVLPVHVFLGGVAELEEMVRRIFERLVKDSVERPWYDKVRAFLGNHLRQVGLFGVTVEFGATRDQLERLVHDFAPAMRNLLRDLSENRKALMLILDDLNGLAGTRRFADWLKSLVDEVATARHPLPLSLVLVGLPERRGQLVESQPSLARVFDLVEIKPLSEPEVREFFARAFGRVNMHVQDQALLALSTFAGGFPAFAHEIGDATFKVDEDQSIDVADAQRGISAAVEVIGRKYIERQVYDAIRSTRYRSILRKLPQLGFSFTRKEAAAKLNQAEQGVLDNFLRKMRDLAVLRSVRERGPGAYEFTSLLYLVFFLLEAQRERSHGS